MKILLDKLSDTLYITKLTHTRMSTPKQITIEASHTWPVTIGFLIAVLIFTMFIVGFDQGQLFSLVEGQSAFDTMWIHEFTHDMRHAAGFPCH
jgi:Probable cobalt transporter subunit (CbtB)